MRLRKHLLPSSVAVAALFLIATLQSNAFAPRAITGYERVIVTGIELIGQGVIPAGAQFQDTEVGGLSGLSYDVGRDLYYVVSDDRSERNPARFYTMSIDLSGNVLQSDDINILGVTTLRDDNEQIYPAGGVDPEAIVYAGEDRLFIASEGAAGANPIVDPFVKSFGLDGRQTGVSSLPTKFLPDGASVGVRNNLAFESLALRPDGAYLFTATENALAQDGSAAGPGVPSHARILAFERLTGQPAFEWVYVTEPVQATPNPPEGEATNGLVELMALDNNGTFLALERSFSQGVGFSVRIYMVRTQGALEVQSLDTLLSKLSDEPLIIEPPVVKELLLDLTDLGFFIDNVEGMTLGPQLEDGRQSLVLISDNNFNPFLGSRVIALALTLDTIPAALPAQETSPLIDMPVTDGAISGAASDLAIWLHPNDPGRSLVIAAVEEGGLKVMDLDGQEVQSISETDIGDIRLHQVDLLYRFTLAGQKVDLVVASDGGNNTLAVWRVDPVSRRLVDVTSLEMPRPIFSPNGGAVDHLTAYQSPITGLPFVFITQDDSNRLAQLALIDDGGGKVSAKIIRYIDLPAGSTPGGMVADRLLGDLYVSLANNSRILRYSAEVAAGDDFSVIQLEGAGIPPVSDALAIYYGPGDTGYLIASSASDQSFLVIDRNREHEIIGQFIIPDYDDLDQVNDSIGLDVVNSSLGSIFPAGVVIAQDGGNVPQSLIMEPERARNGSSNFKFVPWENVAGAFAESLLIDTMTFDPRFPMRNLLPLVIGPTSTIE